MAFRQIISKLNQRRTPLLPRKNFFKFCLLLLIVISAVFLTKNIFAANEYLKSKQQAISTGNNQESWLNEAFGSNVVTGINALVGPIPDDVLNSTTTSWVPSGMVGSASNVIAALYTQPASGIEYIAQVKDNFLGKPIYAQGIGFKGLEPLIPIWRSFRNITYVLFSIFFIIIGVMIILRVKISPQAVITVQSAIPGLITSLILVTFSYAIAGLIIDLSYVFQGIVLSAIFTGVNTNLNANLLSKSILSGNINTTFADISNFNFGTVFFLITKNISLITILIIGGGVGAIIGGLLGSFHPIAFIATGGIGAAVGAIVFLLIILIIIFLMIIKFLFSLIKCYITLILQIILGPLQIAMGAFPNSKINFNSWIIQIIANTAVFPISLIFLVLINVIAESISGTMWAPNVISLPGSMMPFIIAFGGLLLLPKLPDLITETLFQLKPSPFGQAIGEGFGYFSKPAKLAGQAGLEKGADIIEENEKLNTFTKIATPFIKASRSLGIISKRR